MFVSNYWERNQQNSMMFVMVDATGTEVAGLAGSMTITISKAGAAGAGSAGVITEVAGMTGWYMYVSTAAEADTIGPVGIQVTDAAAVQQNLEYVVQQRNAGCSEYTYTVINSATLNPEPGQEVWATTDIAGTIPVWYGVTDAFGVARDMFGYLPCLDPGTYFFWKHEPGFVDDDKPDTEVVT